MKERLFGTIMPNALIERMEEAADPIAEGQRIAIELIAQIAQMPQIGGVHIMAPNNDDVVPAVITEAKKRVSRTTLV
jgi:methylenetetrahydrofolate reductase (NADPH)